MKVGDIVWCIPFAAECEIIEDLHETKGWNPETGPRTAFFYGVRFPRPIGWNLSYEYLAQPHELIPRRPPQDWVSLLTKEEMSA